MYDSLQDHVFVGSALIDMYCKCIHYAKTVFDRMKQKNVVSWTAMVVGYGQTRRAAEAVKIFLDMQRSGIDSDHYTLWHAISACANIASLEEGSQFHGKAMVVGYGQTGRAAEAVKIFLDMQRSGIDSDHYTLGQAISACANIASLEEGSQFHGKAMISGLIHYVTVSNSLVTLYGKCGNIDNSTRLFNEMNARDGVSGSNPVSAPIDSYPQENLISACPSSCYPSQNPGDGVTWNLLIKIFLDMQRSGIDADHFTHGQAISACANIASLEEGSQFHGKAMISAPNTLCHCFKFISDSVWKMWKY